MTLFWIGAIVLLAFIGVPFVVSRQNMQSESVSQLNLNKQIFNQRLVELTHQRDLGELSTEEFEQLNGELQANLLDDTAALGEQSLQQGPKLLLWGLVASAAVVAGALYFTMGHYQKVADWQQSLVDMPKLAAKLMGPEANEMTQDELERFALALRTQLNKDSSDAMGWLLFGRIQMSFGDVKEATDAFEEALQLAPDHKLITMSYAKALAMSGDEAKVGYAKVLYQRLLSQYPNDLDILSQQAFALFESGDADGAYRSWQAMLDVLPKDSPRYSQIEKTLAMLKSSHGQSLHAMPPDQPDSQPATNGLSVMVTVALGEEVSLPSQGYLVVFARAVNGPPMPMAVKRMPLPSLPFTVTLSEQDAMMENYALASVEPFEIVAKVVTHADVATADSLLEAVSHPLKKSDLPNGLHLNLQPISK